MRIAVDTNVFVAAAFNPRSASARIIARIREGEDVLVWNEMTRRETKAILSRIPPISWGEVEPLFRDEGRFEGAVDPDAFSAVTDPDDRKFAALSAAADCPLVTSDHHLLEHRGKLGVDVLSPGDLIGRES